MKTLSVWLCLLLVGNFIISCQASALGDACTPPNDNTNPCTVTNSECDVNECKCSSGFSEEGGACLISLGLECQNADECVSNSKCDADTTGTKKCSCAEGYAAKDGLCSKVLGTACTTTNEGTVCSLENSECKNEMCACKLGYKGDTTCSKILGTDCTQSNGDAVCSLANMECKDGKCVCEAGYKGDVTCSKILGTACTTANEGTVCSLENTECKNEMCACKLGYKGDTTCSKIIGSTCTGSEACPGDENTICKEDKCVCKEDYAEQNAVCTLTVIGKDCSDTLKCEIDNAVCDTETSKCKCDADFTMNVNKCDPKNAAAMAGFGAIVLSLSVLSACLMMF